jgi:hypothetical protein
MLLFYLNDGIPYLKLKHDATCDAEDNATKQQPAFLSISQKEMDDVMW